MNGVLGLALCLIFILIINLSLIMIVNRRLSLGLSVKDGIKVGEKIPEISGENIAGEIIDVFDTATVSRLLIFIDLECVECTKLFSSLKLYQNNYLHDLTFILLRNDLNKRLISKSSIKDQSIFVEEDDVTSVLNVRSYPFFMTADNDGVITQRGYISKNNLVDFML